MDILDLLADDRSAAARPFACPDFLLDGETLCTKTFSRRSDLVRHRRIHSQDRPFNCDWPDCERTFIQRSALTVHQRVHSGERPHACEYALCEKAFSDSSSLARHRRIHTGKRPYKCEVPACLKTFCRKTTLTKHIKRTHGHAEEEAGIRSQQYDYAASTPSDSPATPSDYDHQSPRFHRAEYETPQIQEDYYDHPSAHAEVPLYKPVVFSPHLENLRHSDLREHLDHDRLYLTPPPMHPSHMRDDGTPEFDSPSSLSDGRQRYPTPGLVESTPHPHFSYPVAHSAASQHLASARHFDPQERHHISPVPCHRVPSPRPAFAAPYSLPAHPSQFVGADLSYGPPSPLLRPRRASSASVLADFNGPTPTTFGSAGLGISFDDPRERSRSYGDVEYGAIDESQYAMPPSPARMRRVSSIIFPSASSLPGLAGKVQSQFSSFVTAHLERMEDDAGLCGGVAA